MEFNVITGYKMVQIINMKKLALINFLLHVRLQVGATSTISYLTMLNATLFLIFSNQQNPLN